MTEVPKAQLVGCMVCLHTTVWVTEVEGGAAAVEVYGHSLVGEVACDHMLVVAAAAAAAAAGKHMFLEEAEVDECNVGVSANGRHAVLRM